MTATERPMLTLTERVTRFGLAAERPDRTAAEASKAQVRLLGHLPAVAKRSITYDNASEFFDHETVTAATPWRPSANTSVLHLQIESAAV